MTRKLLLPPTKETIPTTFFNILLLRLIAVSCLHTGRKNAKTKTSTFAFDSIFVQVHFHITSQPAHLMATHDNIDID
jgi:hypothetical protein